MDHRPLRFRVWRKPGILPLCTLRSALAPRAVRKFQPTKIPTTPVMSANPAALLAATDYDPPLGAAPHPSISHGRAVFHPLSRFWAAACRRDRAGVGPDVEVALGRVTVDRGELSLAETGQAGRGQVLLQLRHAARADQGRRDPLVAQYPAQRHLRQRLAAPAGDLVEPRDPRQVVLAQLIGGQGTALARA